jgi:hypothetical protein
MNRCAQHDEGRHQPPDAADLESGFLGFKSGFLGIGKWLFGGLKMAFLRDRTRIERMERIYRGFL